MGVAAAEAEIGSLTERLITIAMKRVHDGDKPIMAAARVC